ncbi:MAG: hypothetical protein H7338_15310 [Candidatus Sericytochromatia bacterium]|nr:hypothetical protein [Candidatus Sericytochromatia bacterium]
MDGNGQAITQARTAAIRFLLNPGVSLKHAGKGLQTLITRPDAMLSKVRERGHHDPVDGVIAGAGTVAAYVGMASLATMAVGAVVALATQGRSLGLITVSRRLATIGGAVGTTTLTGSLLKNQVDLVRARTGADFRKQTNELASDYTSYGFSPAVTLMGSGTASQSAVAFDAVATTVANQLLGRAVHADNPDVTQSVTRLVTLAARTVEPAAASNLKPVQRP